MRHTLSAWALIPFFAFPVFAQKGPCTHDYVKIASAMPGQKPETDDVYFVSGAYDKPIVGRAELNNATEALTGRRKNVKSEDPRPDRIVAAPSGDMAYEYGTRHMIFDESDSGKHQDFTVAYLRVWKADNGSCKVAAVLAHPISEQ